MTVLDIAQQILGYPQSLGTAAALEETAELVRKSGQWAVTIQADVRDRSAVAAAVERTVDELGGLHILIANAGMALHAPFVQQVDADRDLVLETNLLGALRLLRAASCEPAVRPDRDDQQRRRTAGLSRRRSERRIEIVPEKPSRKIRERCPIEVVVFVARAEGSPTMGAEQTGDGPRCSTWFPVIDDVTRSIPAEQDAPRRLPLGAFNDRPKAEGSLVFADGLVSPSTATVIDNPEGPA